MTNRKIYECALHILAQNGVECDNSDYEERASYILATFCSEMDRTDDLMRKAFKAPVKITFQNVWISLDEDFPLVNRFAPLAAKYLAAMLVIDEDGELSDRIYDMYCQSISALKRDIPCIIESTADKYN